MQLWQHCVFSGFSYEWSRLSLTVSRYAWCARWDTKIDGHWNFQSENILASSVWPPLLECSREMYKCSICYWWTSMWYKRIKLVVISMQICFAKCVFVFHFISAQALMLTTSPCHHARLLYQRHPHSIHRENRKKNIIITTDGERCIGQNCCKN